MSDARIRASIEAYVAAWNEREASARLRLLEEGCAEDVLVHTAGRRVEGRAALAAMIADFQARRPGLRAAFASAVDVQGDLFRHVGVVEGEGGRRSGETFDAGACDEQGRIRLLLTFAGAVPPVR